MIKEIIFHYFGISRCHECDTLKLLLEEEKRTTKRLLDELLIKPQPIIESPQEVKIPLRQVVSMNKLRQQLEHQDKADAQHQQRVEEVKKSKVDELEKVLLSGT